MKERRPSCKNGGGQVLEEEEEKPKPKPKPRRREREGEENIEKRN